MLVKDLDDQWLLKTHFFGIYTIIEDEQTNTGRYVLVNPNRVEGSEIQERDILPKSVIMAEIDAAISRVQGLIGADIKLKEHIVEYHDYDRDDAIQYFYVKPNRYPVVQVHSLKLVYGENGPEIMTFNNDYIQRKPEMNYAVIQVLPRFGSAVAMTMDPNLAFFVNVFNTMNAPSMVRLEYDAGIEGLEGELDAELVKVIGMLASIHLFNIWGDIIISPGVANFSTSFDGISMSVGTTVSAENSAFSARIRMYERLLFGSSIEGTPGLLSTLIKRYNRIIVGLL